MFKIVYNFYSAAQFVVIYCISENGSPFDDCVIISPHFITFLSLPPLLLPLLHPRKYHNAQFYKDTLPEVLQQRFPTQSGRVVCNRDHR